MVSEMLRDFVFYGNLFIFLFSQWLTSTFQYFQSRGSLFQKCKRTKAKMKTNVKYLPFEDIDPTILRTRDRCTFLRQTRLAIYVEGLNVS